MAKKKKWKKRLKKLAKAALIGGALYGGAKLLGSRGKDAGAVSTAGQAVGVDRITPKTDYITKKADVVSDALPNTSSNFQTRFKTKIGDKWVGPGEARVVNPHEATAAAGAAYRPITARPNRFNRLKGGGIAKRGTGAAYKKGGRVKSMGIAKRGGGIAKR